MRKLQILMVDDNPADADLAREMLTSGSLQVELNIVIDGMQALEYLRHQSVYPNVVRPDLILLDLNLPLKSGHAVLAEIKSDADLKQIPIIIFTSSEAERDIARSYGLGANCFITKPLELHAFQTIVKAVENFWFTVAKLPPSDLGQKGIAS